MTIDVMQQIEQVHPTRRNCNFTTVIKNYLIAKEFFLVCFNKLQESSVTKQVTKNIHPIVKFDLSIIKEMRMSMYIIPTSVRYSLIGKTP